MKGFVIDFINDYFDDTRTLTDDQQSQFCSDIEAISELFPCDVKYYRWYFDNSEDYDDGYYHRGASIFLHSPKFTVGSIICISTSEYYSGYRLDDPVFTTEIYQVDGIIFDDIHSEISHTEGREYFTICKDPKYGNDIIRESGLIRPCKSARK